MNVENKQTNTAKKIGTFSSQYYYPNNNLLGKKYKPIKGHKKINQTHLFIKHLEKSLQKHKIKREKTIFQKDMHALCE